MAAAEKTLECSKSTSNTALRADLGMFLLEINVRDLRWQLSVKNTQRKRLPEIIESAVWKKTTAGQAGTRWDTVDKPRLYERRQEETKTEYSRQVKARGARQEEEA